MHPSEGVATKTLIPNPSQSIIFAEQILINEKEKDDDKYQTKKLQKLKKNLFIEDNWITDNDNDDDDFGIVNMEILAQEKRKLDEDGIEHGKKKIFLPVVDIPSRSLSLDKDLEMINSPKNFKKSSIVKHKNKLNESHIKPKIPKKIDPRIAKVTPRQIRLTEHIEGCAINRVASSVKNSVIPISIADLMEISPACRLQMSKEMRFRADDSKHSVLYLDDDSTDELTSDNDIDNVSNDSDQNIDDKIDDTINSNTTTMSIPAIGKLYVKIVNTNILAAIDSGADVSMIHPRVLKQLGLEANAKSTSNLRGFTGPIDAKKCITQLPVQAADISIPLDFEVAENCPYPILLGRDWMFRTKAKTSWETGDIIIEYRGKKSHTNMYKIGHVSYHTRWKNQIRKKRSEKDIIFVEKVFEDDEWNSLKMDAEEFGFLIKMPDRDNVVENIEGSNSIEIYQMETKEKLVRPEIYIGDAFKENDKIRIKTLLDKYPKLFGESLEDMRRLKASPLHINVGSASPIKSRSYRIPPQHLPALREAIDELLEQRIIVKRETEWSAPLLMVKKKDGTWRLVADYRELNKVAIKDAGEVPVIQDLIDRTSGSKVFSAMDCRSGFWQWEIDKESIDKTGFSTPFGTFCYVVCPMGFTNSAQGFHRVVTNVFGNMVTVSVEIIIDDVLVHSPRVEDHLLHLEEAFKRAEDARMVFRISKTRIGLKEIAIWSWILSEDGIRPDPTRVSKVLEIAPPTSVRELRQFIGFAQYYRRVIPNFSGVAAVLTDLMSKDGRTKISLNDEQMKSFGEIKKLLTSNIVVKLPNQYLQFFVKTDAGKRAVGGVLTQFYNSFEYPVSYASAKLNKYQMNYGQTKKELLAVIYSFRHWRQYLIDTKFKVVLVTDCTAVRDLMKKRHLSGIFARWVIELQEFDLTVEYKPGKYHADADAMSRMFDEQRDWGIEGEVDDEVKEIYFKEVFYSVAEETELNEIQNFLNGFNFEPRIGIEKLSEHYMVDKNGELFRRNKDGVPRRVIMTKDDAMKIIYEVHNSLFGGHLGIENTIKRLSLRCWWPKMNEDVSNYVKCCHTCQIRNMKKEEELMPKMLPSKIFDKWGGDAVGPLPASNGYSFILLWTDYHSKWVAGRAVRRVTSENISKSLLKDVILEHGVPLEIVTDRGSGYIGGEMIDLKEKYGIKGIKTTSYNARSNGQAERTNQSIGNIVSKLMMEFGSRWTEMLKFAIWILNTSQNKSTGLSPYFLKYGIEPRMPIDLKWSKYIEDDDGNYVFDAILERVKILEEIRGKRVAVLEKLQFGYDKRRLDRENNPRIRKVPLVEGDKVLLWRSELDKQWSGKYEPRWKGPFIVLRMFGNGTYNLGKIDGKIFKNNPVSGRFLKKYRENENF